MARLVEFNNEVYSFYTQGGTVEALMATMVGHVYNSGLHIDEPILAWASGRDDEQHYIRLTWARGENVWDPEAQKRVIEFGGILDWRQSYVHGYFEIAGTVFGHDGAKRYGGIKGKYEIVTKDELDAIQASPGLVVTV